MGVDVASPARFQRLVDRGAGRVWTHWYTEAEAEECRRDPRPAVAAAVRFAVKEAAYKSVGAAFSGAVRWRDIEVLGVEPGWRLALYGEIAELAAEAGADDFRISTCLTDGRVLAMVIAQGSGRNREPGPASRAYASPHTTTRGQG